MTEAQVGEEPAGLEEPEPARPERGHRPGTAPKVQVGETSLGLFARITITKPVASTCATSSKASRNPTGQRQPAAAAQQLPRAKRASAASATQPVNHKPLRATRWPPVVQFGPMSLVNGKVLFSDFSSNQLLGRPDRADPGKLGAFSSEARRVVSPSWPHWSCWAAPRARPRWEVLGSSAPDPAAGAGQGRQGARPEYAAAFALFGEFAAGHGIERGKLSVDVDLEGVLPNGQLTPATASC